MAVTDNIAALVRQIVSCDFQMQQERAQYIDGNICHLADRSRLCETLKGCQLGAVMLDCKG